MTKRSIAHFKPLDYREELVAILKEIEATPTIAENDLYRILKKHPKDNTGYFPKSDLIAAYQLFAGKYGLQSFNQAIIEKIKMKPVRTVSGVTPVTVLTKPFPCPGKCIFCPNDIRMPKSYLSDEPGAQRAEKNHFDPYLQTYNRLLAYTNIGHQIDKAEVIVLGGTWSFYPEDYKIWFVKRMFEALNDFGEGLDQRANIKPSIDVSGVAPEILKGTTYNQAIAKLYTQKEIEKRREQRETASWEELEREQRRNEKAPVRCVGLVLETRPDYISEEEVVALRRLGCTKTQIGLQSLQDSVLDLNKRGHDVNASRRALRLLRQAGFKIHAHWMPNLYGSSVEKDIKDYHMLFNDPDFKPDELKIYPCSLINGTELMAEYEKGTWKPYTYEELLTVVTTTIAETPEYCRLTRIVRDIPGTDIVSGNKLTNFRQIAEKEAGKKGLVLKDIRSREIKHQQVIAADLSLDEARYTTSVSQELFLQYITHDRKIAGFLRLSLPTIDSYIKELQGSAIIREVHVYGQTVNLGDKTHGAAQHLGLGTLLIEKASKVAAKAGFKNLAVISAIGTREYYRKLGFTKGVLYQHKNLS
jgi:elongator complex protein 3